MGKFNVKDETLGSIFLEDKIYKVPVFQRPFSWDSQNFRDLWSDIFDYDYLDESSGAFLGTLVIHKQTENSHELEIIDGQQRLATFFIMLCALRDNLVDVLKTSSSDIYNPYQNPIIQIQNLVSDRKSKGKEPKIKLNGREAIYLEKFIFPFLPEKENEDTFNKRITPIRRLRNAYKYFKEQLARTLLSNLDSKNYGNSNNVNSITLEEVLQKLKVFNEDNVIDKANKILDKITATSFVYVEVEELDDAYRLFETLNDRGLGLSAADLIKNHLMRIANRKGEEIEQKFREIWNNAQDKVGYDQMNTFLRRYWLSSKEKFARTRELYKYYKELTEEKGFRISEEIEAIDKAASIYSELIQPANDITSPMFGIQSIDATQCYSLLMAAKEVLCKPNQKLLFEKVARFIESLSFRYSTICNLDANQLEKLYHLSAIKLRKCAKDKKKVTEEDLKRILSDLVKIMPDDKKFRQEFCEKEIDQDKKRYYILAKIEKTVGTGETGELITNRKEVHVEHIMPLSIEKWKSKITPEVHEMYKNYIGNLTLIKGEWNQQMSNKSFHDKVKIYKESKIKITNDLAKYDDWNEKKIIERQNELADYAVKAWPKNIF